MHTSLQRQTRSLDLGQSGVIEKNLHPRVSIGLPVYNGQNYLQGALDSILAQTYTDFELVISDNASTDATREICQHYATRDTRIRYYRNERNVGLAPNFNRVFELSTGDYFKWAAHDDLLAPEFLGKCVDALDRNPDAALSVSRTRFIDSGGKVLGDLPVDPVRLGSPNRSVRFGHLLRTDRCPSADYSALIVSSVLRAAIPYQSYPGGEHAMRAEVGLRGRFVIVPEYLFYMRRHEEQSYRQHPSLHRNAEWVDAANAGKVFYPHWHRFFDYGRSVTRVPMSRWMRIQCYLRLARWLVFSLNWLRLATDPVWVALPGIWKPFHWLRRRILKRI
jgi:glycosyltransferase involved in cell wall biosynthesis